MSEPKLSRPVPRADVLEIEAYVPGKPAPASPAKASQAFVERFSARPVPEAIAAFRDAAEPLALYPDGSASRLRAAIARGYGLDPAQLIFGNGSDDFLALIALAFFGRRRGPLQPVRFPRLSRSRSARPQRADRRPRARLRRRTSISCSPRSRREPRSSLSPTRTTRPARVCRFPRRSGCTPACLRHAAGASTRPMPNMSPA